MKLSIIIPVLNEEQCIRECLEPLQVFRQRGHEVIIVDGGSADRTVAIATPLCDRVISSDRGRARQMNAGAENSDGGTLVFLHADTLVHFDMNEVLQPHIDKTFWGCFRVRLSGRHILFRLYEYFINLRTSVTGIVTGDQVLVVNRELFDSITGFPDIPLMEDISISRILLNTGRPVTFNEQVVTSSRRWENNGIIRTMLKMWLLRLKYNFGVNPAMLAEEYDRQ